MSEFRSSRQDSFGSRLRWDTNLYPEWRLFEPEDRRKLQRVYRRRFRRRFILYGFWLFVILLVGQLAIVQIDYSRFGVPRILTGAILAGIMGTTVSIPFVLWMHRPLRSFLREELNRHGVPTCVKCGYDLRGQTEARCPECGGHFDPGLLVENRKGPCANVRK